MTTKDLLRRIPSIEKVLQAVPDLIQAHGRELVANCIRETIDDLRERLRGKPDESALEPEAVRAAVVRRIEVKRAPKLSRVINATGVILHTGLGRAVLPKTAVAAIVSEQSGYSLLEVDRESGERSMREIHVTQLLREITGAEAATVVNNNAGATLISLAAVAAGREVIVARGQLVEIGGSFRIPEVMEQSGCRLVEVGTTNKVRLEDYERKIGPNTALLLRVHPSNFRIVGFTKRVALEELVELGRRTGLPVFEDLGSGCLVDLSPHGLDEPWAGASLRAGASLVSFSGDKL
ncbi:MAG: L-seryl-tRNA(Sec) selenium transferase, partial [Planctomycetes bacterium]|nr:L-seryl-tRNA(Sec) selenium transferase [Planctomycetota bacterium]